VGDTDPATEVEGLLEGAGPAESLDQRRTLAEIQRRLFDAPAKPVTFSRYVLLGQLGEGGAGLVFRAYDPELDRKVAIKLLQASASGQAEETEGRARLRREAQAMAKLSHPNIISVFDVGTYDEAELGASSDGSADLDIPPRGVFVVMELLEGPDLHTWLGQAQRTWREVLSVFLAAARGLAAAHTTGLIHRDFKPENVIVADDGRVRVLDFGLAGVLGEPVTAKMVTQPRSRESGETPTFDALTTPLTRHGTVMGTPAYMSPEQHRGETTDARTDQYSFCVALYEALHGEPPFRGSTTEALAEAKREGELAPVPSGSTVPGWLQQVVVRGLHSDPQARWPSMDALVVALGNDPARRRRMYAAGAVILGLVAASLGGREIVQARAQAGCEAQGSTIETVWTPGAREQVGTALRSTGVANAEATAEKTVPWLDAYAREWRAARTDACVATHVRGDLSEALLDRALWCLDERRMDFEALVTELAHAEAGAVERAVRAATNLPRVDPCLDQQALAHVPAPPASQRDRVRAVKADLSRARALFQAARYDEGIALARAAVSAADDIEWPRLRAAARIALGELLAGSGDYHESERQLTDAYVEGIGCDDVEAMADAASGLTMVVGNRLARHDDGRLWGKLAEPHVRRVEPTEGVRTSRLLNNRASLEKITGQYDAAETGFRRALTIRETVLGRTHPLVAGTLNNLANVMKDRGQLAEAQVLYERAAEMRKEVMGAGHPDYALTLGNLAILREAQDASAEALDLYQRALAVLEPAFGPENPRVATVLGNMAWTQLRLSHTDEARRSIDRALEIVAASLGPEHPNYALLLESLVWVQAAQGQAEEAVGSARKIVAILEKAESPSQAISWGRFHLAQALWGANERELALAEVRRAIADFPEDGDASQLADMRNWLESPRVMDPSEPEN
jgi:tetratricopeptide (TPR) repeat protein